MSRIAVLASVFLARSFSAASELQSLNITPTQWLPPMDLKEITDWKDVTACCQMAESCSASEEQDLVVEEKKIGSMPQFTTDQSLMVLRAAKNAWNHGAGTWTQMTLSDRCQAIENYFDELQKCRTQIVNVLMWEIGKNRPDAESEFDRTVQFAKQLIAVAKTNPEFAGGWQTIGSVKAFVRRAAVGIYLTLAPYNYPLNESYACLIPLLLMGNVVIMKIPAVGGLVHFLTMDALAKALPAGTIGFISGSGRATMPPLMQTGAIDGLAFIGGK
jgi:glyceraldehyde-3-phosphate dehydrogenase (NADP+)